MKIAIIGYGKMGKQIEGIAKQKNHEIIAIIDNELDWVNKKNEIILADVAIEFTQPEIAPKNVIKCFELNIPIVCGTTGWHNRLEEMIQLCNQKKQTLFTASNFSIGVNIFAELNRVLTKIMNNFPNYNLSIEETHHTQKLDSPSGTAIMLANDILQFNSSKTSWTNCSTSDSSVIGITSKREDNITGNHSVFYQSNADVIEISHKAFDRSGFALGAIKAAEFLKDKKGYFTMKDLFNF